MSILRTRSSRYALDELHRHNVPVVAIHGSYDLAVPHRTSVDTARRTEGTLVTVQRGGHSWLLKDPESLPAIMSEMLAGPLGDGIRDGLRAAGVKRRQPHARRCGDVSATSQMRRVFSLAPERIAPTRWRVDTVSPATTGPSNGLVSRRWIDRSPTGSGRMATRSLLLPLVLSGPVTPDRCRVSAPTDVGSCSGVAKAPTWQGPTPRSNSMTNRKATNLPAEAGHDLEVRSDRHRHRFDQRSDCLAVGPHHAPHRTPEDPSQGPPQPAGPAHVGWS